VADGCINSAVVFGGAGLAPISIIINLLALFAKVQLIFHITGSAEDMFTDAKITTPK